MPVSTFNADFWRYYLKDNFDEFEAIPNHQQSITSYENLFNDSETWDLTIDLVEGNCTDNSGNSYSITEFIALKRDMPINECKQHLDIEFARWEEQQKAREAKLKYVRDIDNYCWYQRKGGDEKVVTEFDIVLTSIIERYNLKQSEWERYYEGYLRYIMLGRPVTKEIKLEPSQTHSVTEFSKAVWEKDALQVKNLRDDDMREFWYHIILHYEPRIVREYNHYGFIYFEDEKYFLADNVLIKFPDASNKPLELIAKKDGAFPVEENKFVMPPEDAIHLPYFDLGVPKNGIYQKYMNRLLDPATFERQLAKVEDHFCSMVGGDSEYRQWGKLLIAYVFSYIFFEDIYDHFKHVIFLYLYGEGNVGKGEVAKLIQDFYGINYLDSLNTPPARSVDEALELKSEIPQWIDEHVPEVPGKDAKIKDQVWNSWFELKPRPTNIQKNGSWGKERKEVRTMPLFCSNFKPKTDHLLSRCIILEYKKQVRGPESHLQWLKRERDLLQLLMLSFMQNYKLMDRKAFIWDVDRIRTKLKNQVKEELKDRSRNAILQDRQISQFAILLTVHHWLTESYRKSITNIAHQSEEIESEDDATYKDIKKEQIEIELSEILDKSLYKFVKGQIVRSAVIAAHHDPLTDYLETIGTLIAANKVTERHFNWTEEGHLKIWAKAIWDEYVSAKKGTDDMVRRENVEEKLKELSELGSDGELKVVNWNNQKAGETIRQRGFYIKYAAKNELFRNAFNIGKYGPSLTQIKEDALGPQTDDTLMPDTDDELPF